MLAYGDWDVLREIGGDSRCYELEGGEEDVRRIGGGGEVVECVRNRLLPGSRTPASNRT